MSKEFTPPVRKLLTLTFVILPIVSAMGGSLSAGRDVRDGRIAEVPDDPLRELDVAADPHPPTEHRFERAEAAAGDLEPGFTAHHQMDVRRFRLLSARRAGLRAGVHLPVLGVVSGQDSQVNPGR